MPAMRVISVNVGLPRKVQSGRTRVLTSIFKSPVTGRVPVVGDNLVGDRQSDLSVHGGPNKAISSVHTVPAKNEPYAAIANAVPARPCRPIW